MMTRTFLKAEWRKLVMANYPVDRKILDKYLPYKTEIDLWDGTCYLSLVGFMFENVKLGGLKIPFHTNFEEVNLRFYVRYSEAGAWKRGVVFIREIVPKPALSFVANTFYKERYETMPMDHSCIITNNGLIVEYKWKKKNWNSLQIITDKNPNPMAAGSEAEFITEHYWGYTRISKQKTSEYKVEHPRWEVYQTKDYLVDVDFGEVYGKEFAFLASEKPGSVFLAEGSQISVKSGRQI